VPRASCEDRRHRSRCSLGQPPCHGSMCDPAKERPKATDARPAFRLVPRRRGFDRLRSSQRTRTRALAPRVWVRRSSVDRRIENVGWRHLHDPPTINRPAVQFISRRDPARVAALRVAVLAGMAPPIIAIRWSTDETPGPAAGHPLARKCAGVGVPPERPLRATATRSAAARAGRRRAIDCRKRACPRSPERPLLGRGWDFRSSGEPRPAPPARVPAVSREHRTGQNFCAGVTAP